MKSWIRLPEVLSEPVQLSVLPLLLFWDYWMSCRNPEKQQHFSKLVSRKHLCTLYLWAIASCHIGSISLASLFVCPLNGSENFKCCLNIYIILALWILNVVFFRTLTQLHNFWKSAFLHPPPWLSSNNSSVFLPLDHSQNPRIAERRIYSIFCQTVWSLIYRKQFPLWIKRIGNRVNLHLKEVKF